jgi:hypothetical protein
VSGRFLRALRDNNDFRRGNLSLKTSNKSDRNQAISGGSRAGTRLPKNNPCEHKHLAILAALLMLMYVIPSYATTFSLPIVRNPCAFGGHRTGKIDERLRPSTFSLTIETPARCESHDDGANPCR